MKVFVLRGFDGTDLLLDHFILSAPRGLDIEVMSLPDSPINDYQTLSESISLRLRVTESCHLIAESLSGPLGILLASRNSDIVRRLTLVTTFAESPVPWIANWIPWPLLFRLPLPSIVAKHFFVGSDREMVKKLRRAVSTTSPETLVKRMKCLMNVDVTQELSSIETSISYLRFKHDRLIGQRCVDRMTKINPAVRVQEIDGPHLILQTQPPAAWRAIERFEMFQSH